MPAQPSSTAAAISNAVVHIMTENTGRGAAKARTYITEGLIAVVLDGTFTKAERTLLRNGEGELVMRARRAFQRAMREELIEAIEQLSGRRVRAFFSDHDIEQDIALESFMLEPRGE